IHHGEFDVLDDTVGHPDSINALFEAVAELSPKRLSVAFAVRGRRGADINYQTAQAFAIWAAKHPLASVVVTSSEEAADERNEVDPEELAAFTRALDEGGIPYRVQRHLGDAVHCV